MVSFTMLCFCVSGRDLIKVLKWYVDRIIEADRQEHIQQVLKVRALANEKHTPLHTTCLFSLSHISLLVLLFIMIFSDCHYCPPSPDFVQFIFVMH